MMPTVPKRACLLLPFIVVEEANQNIGLDGWADAGHWLR